MEHELIPKFPLEFQVLPNISQTEPFFQKNPNTDKENQEIILEKQLTLMNLSVNATANYLQRSDIMAPNQKTSQKQGTDSFARHKAQKLEIRFSDFYKSKKEFKLVSEEERKFLLEDLYEADKCYYFNTNKVEIHSNPINERVLKSCLKIIAFI